MQKRIRTHAEYIAFLRNLPCTREAIDAADRERAAELKQPHCNTRYPDEWYKDKNNRLAGKPSGHLRFESGRMVWIPTETKT